MKQLFNRFLTLIASVFSTQSQAESSFDAKEALRKITDQWKKKRPLMHAGGCNIAYRASCRTTNQRKARKQFRQFIAAGGR